MFVYLNFRCIKLSEDGASLFLMYYSYSHLCYCYVIWLLGVQSKRQLSDLADFLRFYNIKIRTED